MFHWMCVDWLYVYILFTLHFGNIALSRFVYISRTGNPLITLVSFDFICSCLANDGPDWTETAPETINPASVLSCWMVLIANTDTRTTGRLLAWVVMTGLIRTFFWRRLFLGWWRLQTQLPQFLFDAQYTANHSEECEFVQYVICQWFSTVPVSQTEKKNNEDDNFCDIALCNLLEVDQRFWDAYCYHHSLQILFHILQRMAKINCARPPCLYVNWKVQRQDHLYTAWYLYQISCKSVNGPEFTGDLKRHWHDVLCLKLSL